MKVSTLDYLDRLGEVKIDFDFKRSVKLNKLFYKKLPVITICGTNGKGSTTAFLEQILIEAGYRVGAYTSPHLEHVRERIRINGKKISTALFEKYGVKVRNKIIKEKIDPTYFEFLTFLALDIFENEKMDVAIFEVGMGGRLDSTNAIPRMGAILTSISMDHMEYLGNTLEKIAKEKLPILEESPFSVASKQEREIESLIQSSLKKSHQREGLDFFHSGSADMFLYQQGSFLLGPVKLGIHGDHQSSNAACATTMALHLQNQGWNVALQSIVNGLKKARNPGRIEKWVDDKGFEIWLDVAHNADSVQKLVQHFYVRHQDQFQTIFGCSSDKPWDDMIRTLQAITKEFHFVSTNSPRSWNPADKKLFTPVETLKNLVNQQKFPILCAGSFYHLGGIRKTLPKLGFQTE